MANSDKNIIITPGTGSTSILPNITFTGAGNSSISLKMYDDDVLSFETDAVKMLSMNDETDSIQLSVTSDYGIPSLEVGAAGTIVLGKYGQFVGVNSTAPTTNLDVVGDVNIAGNLSASRIGDIPSIRGLYRTTPKRKFTLLPYYRGAFNIRGIGFGGTDGKNLYIANDNNDRIYHFRLSTGYDLETISYVSEKDIGFATTENSQQTQDIYIKPDGTSIYTIDLFTDRIHQYNLSTPFDLTTAGIGTGVSVLENEESAGALTFKPDGTKVYFSGTSRDMIYQASLTTPWDISTFVGVDTSVGVGVREGRPEGVTFRSDGTKMYLIGSGGDSVLQYNLSTPWRVGTAIFEKSFSVSSQDNAPRDITFKSDGTVMYIIGNQNNSVRSYTLSTAWDIGTASFTGTFSVSSQSTSPTAISFRSDGSRMYVLSGSRLPDGGTADQRLVHQYNLSSNWDITSAGFSTSYNFDANRIGSGNIGIASTSVTQLPRTPQGLAFKSDGTVMYVADFMTKQIHQYTLSSAWAVDSARDSGKILDTIGAGIGYLTGISFDTTGTILYVVDDYFNRVHQYYLSTAWDISTATTTKGNFYNAFWENNIESMRFNSDGTKLIVLGRDNSGFINSYNLRVPYDISTLAWEKRVFLGDRVGNEFYGMDFSNDGTKLYLYANTQKFIYQLDLRVPYDISTFTFDDDSAVMPQWYQANLFGLTFSPDGYKMYTISFNEGQAIVEYSLAQPWEIKSPAYQQRVVMHQSSWGGASEFTDQSLHSIHFKPDGTKLFFAGYNRDRVYSFDLEVPWNIATVLEPISSFYVGEQSLQLRGVDFSTDGTKLYVNDEVENKVFEYVMSKPWDITTASYNNVSFLIDDPYNYSMAFRRDGKAFYIAGIGNENVGTASSIILDRNPNRRIYEYALATPWELRTAYATGNYFDVSDYEPQPLGLYVRPDNSELYMTGNVGRRVWKFKFPTQKKVIVSGNTDLTGDLNVYQNLNVSGEVTSYTGLFTKLGVGTDPSYYSSTDLAVRRNAKLPAIGSKADVGRIRRIPPVNASKYYTFRGPNREQPRYVYSYYFKTDGTKLYIHGYADSPVASQAIWEYTLSTPYDVTTITSSKYNNFTEQNIIYNRTGITFADNGSAFYYFNAASDSQYAGTNYILQYNMATAWDTATAQPAKTFFTGNQFQGRNMQSMKFNNDGTRMYLLGQESDTSFTPTQEVFIVQYDLTTPYDITTAKYSFIYDLTWLNWSDMVGVRSLFFKPDGKDLYIGMGLGAAARDNASVVHIRLKTAWDLRTAYIAGDMVRYASRVYNLIGSGDGLVDIGFDSTGTKFFTLLNSEGKKEIRQYSLNTAWDLFSIPPEPSRSFDIATRRFCFKPDGSRVYAMEYGGNYLYEIYLKTPWNIDSIEGRTRSYIDIRRVASSGPTYANGAASYYDFAFKPDGTKLYLSAGIGQFYGFEEYTLDRPWDITRLRKTGIFNGVRKVYVGGAWSFAFKPDGKKIILMNGNQGERLQEITLSTPWDLNSASYDTDYFWAYEVSQSNGVGFGSTGSDMYICDQNSDRVWQYKLGTAFDVRTAEWTGLSTSFNATDNTIRDAFVGAGGTYIYIVGGQTNRIYQYTLPNNNITQVGFVTSFGTTVLTTPPNSGMNEATPLGVTFKPDGTVMYVVGNASGAPAGQMYQNPRRIHQYTLSTPWNVATAGFSTYFNVTWPAATGREAGTWVSNEFWKLRFKPDGNRMYLLDRGTFNVHQFDLGQSWNAPTAVHVGSFYVGNEEFTQPYGMDISPDGTKLYIIGFNYVTVFQYTLTTPWDVTTAKINKGKRSRRLAGDGSFNKFRTQSYLSLRMSDDGLTGYIVDTPGTNSISPLDSGNRGTFLYQIDFGRPWDVRTVGLTTYYEIPNTPDVNDVYIKPDRTRLYTLEGRRDNFQSSKIDEYEFETFDDAVTITSKLNVGSVNVNSELSGRAATFENVGIGTSSYNSNLTVRGNSYLRTIGNEFDIRELTLETNKYFKENTLLLAPDVVRTRGYYLYPYGLTFSNDGCSMYVLHSYSDSGFVEQYSLATPWNVTTGAITTSFYCGDFDRNNSNHQGDRQQRGLYFKPDGSAFYTVGVNSDRVYQYNLTTPWDIATVGTAQTYFVGSSRGGTANFMQNSWGISFRSDGTRMYVLDRDTRDLTEFTLTSSPWNVGIATTTGASFNIYTVYTNSDWGSTQFEYYPTSVYFKPDGTKFWVSGERGHAIYEFSMSTAWNIGIATESARLFVHDYGTRDPRGVSFSNDGRTLYFMSEPNSRVYQVGLGTAWDINSAIKPTTPPPVKTLTYYMENYPYQNSQYAYSLNFTPDGKKMFVGDGNGIFEYSLSTPWAVGFSTLTAKYGNWLGNNPQGNYYPAGSCFRKDGKKLYLVNSGQQLFEYDVIEPWSLNSVRLVGSAYIGNYVSGRGSSVSISDDGTKIYIASDFVSGYVTQFDLTVPWSVNSLKCLDDSFPIIETRGSDHSDYNEYSTPVSIQFKPDGTRFYVLGDKDNRIYQYDIGIGLTYATADAWDIRAGSISTSAYVGGTDLRGFFISTDGTKAYTSDYTDRKIYQYNLNTAWDVGSINAGVAKTYTVTSPSTANYQPAAIYFRDNGTTMFVNDYISNRLHEYTLSPAWDVSTATHKNTQVLYPFVPSIYGETDQRASSSNPFGLFFKPDGTEVYISELSAGYRIKRYKMRTAWDITTMYRSENQYTEQSSMFDIGDGYYIGAGMYFKPDGSKLYLCGGYGNAANNGYHDRVVQLTLSTPWNFKTARKINQKIITFGKWDDITGTPSNPIGPRIKDVQFAAGGKKLFLLGYAGYQNVVTEYDLDIPWEINTYTITNKKFDYLKYIYNTSSLFVKPDGSKLFIGDANYGQIHEFEIPSEDIDLVGRTNVRGDLNVDGALNSYGEINSYRGNFGSVGIGTTGYDVTMSVVGKADISSIGNEVEFGSNINYNADALVTPLLHLNRNKSIGGNEGNNQWGFTFSPDGTNFFKTGASNTAVYQWKLGTPFDLRTAKYYNAIRIADRVRFPRSIKFRPNGTSMVVVCGVTTAVYQYSMGTAWDITTAGFSTSFSIIGRDNNPRGVGFRTDGTSMYVTGQQNSKVYQFALSTPWNVSTAGFTTDYTVSALTGDPTGVGFGTTGSKMYVTDATNSRVIEYNLSTPWNVSTSGLSTVFSIAQESEPTYPQDIELSNDGYNMFVHDRYHNATYRYQLTTPFTLSTAQRPYGTFSIYRNPPVTANSIDRIGAFYMRPDRQKMYTSNSGRIVYEYTMSVPGDIRTAQYSGTVNLTSSVSNINGLNFSPDGRKMFAVDNQATTSSKIVEYNLSSPWNLNTVGVGLTFNIGRVSGGALYVTPDSDITFNSDGTKFYLGGTGTWAISEWNTKTPWSLDGALPVFESFYAGNQDTIPANIAWNTDGTRFFVLGYTNATIYQYDVPIDRPFDVRFAAYNGISYSVSTRDTAPLGLTISPDGTRMYISGTANDSVYQFTLNAAWSISSVTFVGSFSVASQQTNPSSVKFSSDGKLMFIGGNANSDYDQMHQYILNTPWTVSTAYYSNTMYDFYDSGSGYRLSGLLYFDFSADGRRLYAYGRGQNRMQHYDLERPWDITTLRHRGSFYFRTRYQGSGVNIISSEFNGFTFRPDGRALYIVDATYDRIYTYYLETPWNIATAYLPGIAVFDHVTYPTTFSFSNDGYRLYVLDSNSGLLREYTLKTAWAIHSWIPKDFGDVYYNPFFYTGYSPRAIRLMPDGETMYFANNTNIWELKLNNLKKVSINNNTQIAGSLEVKQSIEVTGAKINGELTAASIGIGVSSALLTTQLQVGAASTQSFVVTRSGSVGIGITNPRVSLQTQGSAIVNEDITVGTQTARASNGTTARVHIEGTNQNTSAITVIRNSNDANEARIIFGKSRSTGINGVSGISSSDNIGKLEFNYANGSNIDNNIAYIQASNYRTGSDSNPTGALSFGIKPDSTSSQEGFILVENGSTIFGGGRGTGTINGIIDNLGRGIVHVNGNRRGFRGGVDTFTNPTWIGGGYNNGGYGWLYSGNLKGQGGVYLPGGYFVGSHGENVYAGSCGIVGLGGNGGTYAAPGSGGFFEPGFTGQNGVGGVRGGNYAFGGRAYQYDVLYIDRTGNDGTLVTLRQDGTEEGSITVSGTTVSYNGGHLSRWSQVQGIDPYDKNTRPEILLGTVMSNVDEMCEWITPEQEEVIWTQEEIDRCMSIYGQIPDGVQVGDIKVAYSPEQKEDNWQLNKTIVSNVENDKKVAGVFQDWDDDDGIWVNDYHLAMTGDFVIRIGFGVTVENGDLLTSAGDGTAKPQSDDLIRSSTIAKVISNHVVTTHDDGSYCVPCVLMIC